MVQLRVDVEAANARAAFDNAARGVDGLTDEMRQAERESQRLDRAYAEAGAEVQRLGRRLGEAQNDLSQFSAAATLADREVDRLQAEIRRLGTGAPQQLRDDLRAAQLAARGLHDNVRDARQEVSRLGRETTLANAHLQRSAAAANHAGDEVRRLAAQLNLATLQANLLRHEMNRVDAAARSTTNNMARGLLGFRQQVNGLLSTSPLSSLTSGLSAAWAAVPVEVKGVIIAAGIAMAITLATAIGAAINGLLLAAIGGGVAAAAVAVAVQSSAAVRSAFGGVFGPIADDVKTFAVGAVEGPLVAAADRFGEAWHNVGDDVGEIFAEAGRAVEPLADGLSGLVENTMPGLKSAVEAAGPVLRQLGHDLPMVGDALSDMFQSFADGDGAVKGLHATMMLLSGILITVGDTVEFLSDQFDTFTESAEAMTTGLSRIPIIGQLFEGFADTWRDFNEGGTGAARALEKTDEAAGQAAGGLHKVATAAEEAAAAAGKLNDVIDAALGKQLSIDEANLRWHESLSRLTESFKDNGLTLDENSKKGQANREAVLASVRAAQAARDAKFAETGSVTAANQVYDSYIDQLRKTLRQMGLSEAQANSLIAAYKSIPNEIVTRITTIYQTRFIGGRLNRQAELGPNYSSGVGGYAAGTPYAPPGWAWIGEAGPELMNLRGGERILSTQASARKAARYLPAGAGGGWAGGGWAGAGGGEDRRTVLEIRSGGSRLDDLLVDLLARAVGERGGDVQLVLGGRR